MLKILINGINGKMGKEVAKLILANEKMHLLGGLDHQVFHNLPYKIYSNIEDLYEKPNVIIDFSVPEATIELLPYCIQNHVPIVIATTGFSEEQSLMIKEAAEHVAIFQSSNMSYEISLLRKVISEVVKALPNSEIEIVETHHNRKKDAPSGTALMLADCINKASNHKYYYELNRFHKSEKRNPDEIGFSSIRGGNIIGEHSVLFFNENETFEIKHTAYTRSIFAEGAIKAAEFICTQKIGYFETSEAMGTDSFASK